MHGRVLALHGLVFLGSTPIGGPLLGWICEAFGARAGLVIAGGTALLAGLALMPRLHRLRRAVREQDEPDREEAERAGEVPPKDTVPRPTA
jgi:hypothetical protein